MNRTRPKRSWKTWPRPRSRREPGPGLGHHVQASLAGLTLLFSGAAGAQVMPCRYNVTIIEQPCSGTGIYGTAINDQSPPTIAGFYTCGIFTDKPYYWNANTGLVTLQPMPPGVSTATGGDINNLIGPSGVGQFSGTVNLSQQGYRGFLWDSGVWHITPTVPSGNSGGNGGISKNADWVFGSSHDQGDGDPPLTAYKWRPGEMITIAVPYGPHAFPSGSSDDGSKIVGAMGVTTWGNCHAFLWDNGVVTDIGTVPGGYIGGASSINSKGQVSVNGRIKDPDAPLGFRSRGYVWEDGVWTLIPWPEPYVGSAVGDILESGLMLVGFSYARGGGEPALWYRGAHRFIDDMLPPNSNIDEIGVSALNNKGSIVGTATLHQPFKTVAVLLTPVPAIRGDTNFDQVVDVDDLLAVINAWGSDLGGFSDLDGNGEIDVSDLLAVLLNWGSKQS